MERMKRLGHLEVHDITLETEGPLFVGSGTVCGGHMLVARRELGYVTGVDVLDERRLAEWLREHKKWQAWANHMKCPNAQGLDFFSALDALDEVPLLSNRYLPMARPTERIDRWRPFVRQCDKTAYLPGSTLKGCVATAFLVWRLNELPEQTKACLADEVRGLLQQGESVGDEALHRKLFHHLHVNTLDEHDSVNSDMRAYSFDDSRPISDAAFFLAARDDYGARGSAGQEEWRETIRPHTVLSTRLTIDVGMMSRSRSMLTVLSEALTHWQLLQERVFYDRIRVPHRAPVDRRTQYVYLGGGAGFINKTLLYALFERDEAREWTNALLARRHKTYRPEWGKETAPYNRHVSFVQEENESILAYDVGKCRITINY